MHEESQGRKIDDIQEIVKNLLFEVIPESQKKLDNLWRDLQIQFKLFEDSTQDFEYIGSTSYFFIHCKPRLLRALWVASFAAWEGYCASAYGFTNLSHFQNLLDCVDLIMKSDDSVQISMPEGVPEPGVFVDATINPQARAAGELGAFVCAWALLHEVCHLQKQQEGSSVSNDAPSDEKKAMELSCDYFATQYILEHASEYANANNIDIQLLEQKRQIGVHFALFALTILTRYKWTNSTSHPDVQVRINQAWEQMNDRGLNSQAVVASFGAFYALHQLWNNAPSVPQLSIINFADPMTSINQIVFQLNLQ